MRRNEQRPELRARGEGVSCRLPCPSGQGPVFTFSAWLSSSLGLSLSLGGGSGPRPSSSNNCAFMVKSQAAVRSRALGLTGEGPCDETQL